MEITPGELADRFSILQLKVERLPFNESVEYEYNVFREAVRANGIPTTAINQLIAVNGQIWNLESELRQGKERSLPISIDVRRMQYEELMMLAEIGKRALAIRNLNARRVALKNELNEFTGNPFREVKGNHVSA